MYAEKPQVVVVRKKNTNQDDMFKEFFNLSSYFFKNDDQVVLKILNGHLVIRIFFLLTTWRYVVEKRWGPLLRVTVVDQGLGRLGRLG